MLGSISGLYSPLFILFFTGRAGLSETDGNLAPAGAYFYGCAYAICLIILFGLLDPHWQFHEPALHCFLGNLFLPFPQPFAPCYDKILDWAGIGRYPVLLVGAGKTAQLLLRGIKDDVGLNYHVIGYVDDAGERKENVGNLPYLGTLDEIEPILTKTQVNDVFIAAPGLSPKKLDSLIYRIQPLVRNLSFIPDLIGLPVNGVTVEESL